MKSIHMNSYLSNKVKYEIVGICLDKSNLKLIEVKSNITMKLIR
jgi:hypothetical protein